MNLFAWKALQIAIAVGFVFGDIYFEWHIGGLAAGVMGGMLAYYVTKVILALRGDLPPSRTPDYSEAKPSLSLRDWRSSKDQEPR